ncbi:MAG: hypothetical protein LUE63_04515 [Lachnospiraceae bacterium]|nr:hypothetical protein [Lachnospiraceae bacterium]
MLILVLVAAGLIYYLVTIREKAASLSEEEAISLACEYAETYTLSNDYFDTDDTAEAIECLETTAEWKRFHGTSYWYVTLEASVTFTERGTVSKTYDVRINARTGEFYDMVWSLT